MHDFLYSLSKRGPAVYWLGYLYLSFLNHVFNRIPFFSIRYFIYKYLYGLKIGNSVIHMGVKMFSPWNIKVGDNVLIHFDCFFDGRGVLEIKDNIDISFGVKIFTEQHDLNSDEYGTIANKVVINNHAVIGSYSMILPGVTIGEGAVVAAGSVVTKSVAPYVVVGGVPAREIKKRDCNVKYLLNYKRPFH